MNRAIQIHGEALEDVLRCMQYLDRESPAMAARFRNSVDKSIELIRLFPEGWAYHQALLPKATGLRQIKVSGFPKYLVIYRTVRRQNIEILRIVHSARDLPSLIEDHDV